MALFLIVEQGTIVGVVDIGLGETYTPPAGRQLMPVQPTTDALPMKIVELEQRTADPGTPINGQIWYNNAASEMRARINGVTKSLGAAGGWPLGNVITVHPTDPDADFTTITAACAAATAGDVILVAPSLYTESVTVPAQVDLVGLFAGKNSASPPIIQFNHTTSGATVTLGNFASLMNFKVIASCSTNSITVSAVSVGNGTVDGCNITARNISSPAAALNLRGITKTGSSTTLYVNHSYVQVLTSGGGSTGTAYAFYDDTSVITSLGDANEFFDNVTTGTHAAMLFNNASCNIFVYGSNYAWGDVLLTSYQTLSYRGGCFASSAGSITGLSDQSDNAKLFAEEKTNYQTSGKLRMFKAALRSLTSDPSDAADGDAWYRSDLTRFRIRENGVTYNWRDAIEATKAFAFSGDLTPAQITANQNDYAPTGLADASVLRLSTDASRTVTGLTGGADGRVMVIINVGSFLLTLADESASSTAANRFALGGAAFLLKPGAAIALWYDSTTSRWRNTSDAHNNLPDLQTFTGNGTWTKPLNATRVRVVCVGGGGGGGSGGKGTTNDSGGGGGGGGAYESMEFDASTLGATESVTVGAAANGGAAQTVTGAGNGGTAGNSTSFGSFMTAVGGGAGGGGATASGTAGSATFGEMANGGGGGAGDDTAAGASGSRARAGGGGGGGGGVNGGANITNGGTGGAGGPLAGSNSAATGGGGTAGTGSGTSGGAGAAGTGIGAAGSGGGGGAGNLAGNGGTGGAGGAAGGGGGGGGATNTGTQSGAGGQGAAGACWVISW